MPHALWPIKTLSVISILIEAVRLESGFGGVWDEWSRWDVGWATKAKISLFIPAQNTGIHFSEIQKKNFRNQKF